MRHVDADGAVEQYDEGAGPHQVAERGGVKEACQPGGGKEEEQGNEEAHAQVEPEEGVGFFPGVVLLADEGAAESGGGQGACGGEEDGGESHEPHFFFAEQAGQYHAVYQRDGLQGAFLQQHPAYAVGGLSGDAGHFE